LTTLDAIEVADTPGRLMSRRLELDPMVAIRPEPFGALAYHYGNRRLVFLKHPDVVRVVESLGVHASVSDALDACGIAASRRPSFATAIESLIASELLRDRSR
jgi:putative mycofactocin binding protein MftB